MSTLPLTSAVSAANSTTATLASAGVFTGTSVDVTQFASVTVQVFTDVVSATNGLSIQQSVNGTNWDNPDVYTIPANDGKTFAVQITAQFLRVVYTNGATAQATFRLQTMLHAVATPTSSVRPQDGRTNDNDMQEHLAFNMVYNPTTNVWDRQQKGSGLVANGALVTTVSALGSQTDTFASTGTQNGTVYDTGSTGLHTVSVDVTTIGTAATINFQTSNDAAFTVPRLQMLQTSSAAVGAPSASITTASGVWSGTVFGRYFRVQVTGQTAGTTTAISSFSNQAATHLSPGGQVSLNGTSAVNVSQVNGSTAPTVTPADAISAVIGSHSVAGFTEIYNGSTWERARSVTGAQAAGTGTLAVGTTPSSASLGLTPYFNSALVGTATAVKTSSGRLFSYYISNPNNTTVYVQIHNATTGSVTLGTTVPTQSWAIPPGGVSEDYFDYSLAFTNGITIAATTTATGSTAPATGLVVNMGYL